MAKKRKQTPSRPDRKTPLKKNKAGMPDGLIALLLSVFGFLLYANTLGHGYVMDDDLAMSVNPNVIRGIAGIGDIFTQPYREQCFGGCLYRPLTLAMFAIEWAIAPKSPFIGHLMNAIWYAATSGVLFLTLRKLIPNRNLLLPLIAAILFTAHPIHTEVVANIKSRDEILSLFFVLLSIFQFARWYEKRNWKSIVSAGLAFLAALLSKEGAITAIVVFPLIGWIFFRKSFFESIKYSAWILVPLALFFLMRGAALSGLTEPEISMMDNPIVDAKGTELFGTAFVILAKYLFLLVMPWKLVSDYTYNVIPLHSLGSLGSITGLVLYLALAAIAVYGLTKRYIGGFIAAAYLVSISLYSQLPKVIGTIMGERLLYTPSLWFVLGLTLILAILFKVKDIPPSPFNWKQLIPAQRNLIFVTAAITLFYGFQTVNRNRDWVSNLKLYEADIVNVPNSVRMNDGYAEELYKSTFAPSLSANEIDSILTVSEQYSRKSLAIKPGVSAYNNLGNVNFTRKNFEEAISYYQKTLDILKNYPTAEKNIAYTLMVWAREEGEKHNNPVHARELLQRALQYDENNSEVWRLIGISYGVQGNYQEAVKAFEKAYSLAPTDANIKHDLSETYLKLGMVDKAEALK